MKGPLRVEQWNGMLFKHCAHVHKLTLDIAIAPVSADRSEDIWNVLSFNHRVTDHTFELCCVVWCGVLCFEMNVMCDV